MKLDVYFTPPGPTAGDLAGRGVVVIDVLRATTTIITALANGARAVVPTASSEEAVKMTANLERDGFVLAGERRYLPIPGFPLGNSPNEMTPEQVGAKTVYLATTNGTPALVAAQGADPVLVGAAVNFGALADRAGAVLRDRGDLAIICAGREKQFALEDAYVAGRLVKVVKKGLRKLALNDGAEVSLALTQRYKNFLDAFTASEAGRALESLQLGDDVQFSAKMDRYALVPAYADRRIT
ncbi:MAG TPA: 2-phosphosulfolactate phosphatase [Gemmatimonadales bacterium]|jgi:2-phosphosulfolactate phosphatase|nr:2-phosphosulfolactate phosphatase [Gemmatimonadales bacterium]